MYTFHKTISRVHDFLSNNSFHLIVIALVVMGGIFMFLFQSQQQGSTAGQTQPNIVFILTDDESADNLAYHPKVKSLLADQGTTFTKFYYNIALCCPSRAAIQRGQYSHNTQITGNVPPQGGFQQFYANGDVNSTMATWLKNAGYKTFMAGKYLNQYSYGAPTENYIPPGWNEFYSPIDNGGYKEYNYKLNENGTIKTYKKNPSDYLLDKMAGFAANFIGKFAGKPAPLFMYIAPYCPHGPATPPDRYATLSEPALPQGPSFNETDVSDKPAWIQALPPLTTDQISTMSALYQNKLRCLQAVDDLTQTVVNSLTSTGRMSNTYIFYVSDNGFHMGQHRLFSGKNTAYEEDINFPLIVRGPGVPIARVDNTTLIGNVDLAPTFAELGKATAPSFVDGRSIVSLLGGNLPPPGTWRNSYLLEHGTDNDSSDSAQLGDSEPADVTVADMLSLQKGGKKQKDPTIYMTPPFTALRTLDYLYVEYDSGDREFYNVTADPYELVNTYSTTDPVLINTLSVLMHALKTCQGSTCRTLELQQVQGITPTPTTPPLPTVTPTSIPTSTPSPTDIPTPTPTP